MTEFFLVASAEGQIPRWFSFQADTAAYHLKLYVRMFVTGNF
jgi:hypothetical protein